MASSVEDIEVDHMDHIPDLSSILEHGITSRDSCQIEKDSSNDEDIFGDSSQEGSHTALDMFAGFDTLSVGLPLDECPVEALTAIQPTEVEPPPAASQQNLSEMCCPVAPINTAIVDEDCLMRMSKDEEIFYDNYLSASASDLSSLRCTVCSQQLFIVNPANIKLHPTLGVLVCKGCRDFYNSGEFSKDESGYDEYCRWCAEGGSLICCDTCTNVFCKSCLRRCLGRAALQDIKNGGGPWSCLVCNQQPLWTARALSRVVLIAMERKKRNLGKRPIESQKPSSPSVGTEVADEISWIPACISEAEKLALHCQTLANKAASIWNSEVNNGDPNLGEKGEANNASNSSTPNVDKKKVVECCRQLRKALSSAYSSMKVLDKKIVRSYKKCYGSTSEIEVDDDDSSTRSSLAQTSNTEPSSPKRLVLKIKNFRESTKKEGQQDYYAEIRDSPQFRGASKVDSSNAAKNSITTTKPSLAFAKEAAAVSQNTPLKMEPIASEDDDNEQFFDTCSNAWDEDHSEETNNRSKSAPVGKKESVASRPVNENCENNSWSPFNASELGVPSLSAEAVRPDPASISAPSGEQSNIKSSALNGSKRQMKNSSQKTRRRKEGSSTQVPKTSPAGLSDKNEDARKKLLQESSSESDSDSSLENLGLLESPGSDLEKQADIQRPNQFVDPETDAKLNSECAVVVKRIVDSNLNPENGDDRDDEFAAKPKKTNPKRGSTLDSDQENVKRRSERKTFRLSDLSSTSDSSSDDDSSPEAETTLHTDSAVEPTPNVHSDEESKPSDQIAAVRQELLASSSPESDGDASDDEREDIGPLAEQSKAACNELADAADGAEPDQVEQDTNGVGEGNKEAADDMNEERSGVKKSSKLLKVPNLADSDDSDDFQDGSKPDASKGSNIKTEETEKESKKKNKKAKEGKKKRRIHSDSDFESSESDSEEGKKKRKRKGKKHHEDDDDKQEEDSEEFQKPKRRRRIKKQSSSSDEAGSDSDVQILNDSENAGKTGRKNIKRIMKDKNLQDETKAAAKEEEERRRRIAERQKHYNDVFTENALVNAQIDHLVLDFEPKTKKELVTVHKSLVKKLKPHQVKGVKFMWDACFESLERIKEHPGSGCILAHCMGLGKSLQVVTLVHTVLTHPECKVKRVLVVCPLSTVLNWVNEFKIWLTSDDMEEVEVYEMSSLKTNDLRMYTLRNWFEAGGVMILGYDMFRNLTNDKKKGVKPKMREVFQRSLVDPGPDLVICDEGHLLKNEATAISKAMNRVQTKRRVVLTGTPLQNSLLEYHCMVQFVKPNLLGNKREFTNRFANPIKNGQCADSTDHDVRVMKRRAHVLHKMLEDSVQRFDYSVLTPFLPPKHEYVISVKMSDLQIQMYQYYLERCAKGGPNANMSMGRGKGSGLFADFQELGRVWTHPRALHLSQLRRDNKAIAEGNDSEGSMADFIDDGSGSESDDGGVVCLDDSAEEKEDEDEPEKINGWRSRTRAGRGNQPPPEEELGVTTPLSSAWWSQFVNDDDMVKLEHSGKLVLLMDILRQCELIGDKVLVFSQSLVSLDLIEEFLVAESERIAANRSLPASKEDVPIGSWTLNVDYFRLDGSTSAELRKTWTNHFNNPSNLRARLFLISTRAGGLGINLVAANRVIIFDASWNPSHDVQSIFRIYRFGQKKPCYVYRFLAQGTMEEKIYDRQVTKLSLSCRVVDEQQIERHFNSADLNELYCFEADSHTRRPTPPLPKDRLLAELMIKRKEWIVTFHEHDSLLENKEEEELNEEERKAAWEDFENEKRGLFHSAPNVYGGVTSEMGAMSGMIGMSGMGGIPDIMGLAGRTVAGIPLSSIAAMILNSNPGITQDEFLGRLRLTVDQLQNFSVQQAAASNSMSNVGAQQPGDVQRLLIQRQVAADQLKRQFGPQGSASNPGPSGIPSVIQPRSRGRPPIGPHQRTDLYGLAPVIYSSTSNVASSSSSSQIGRTGSSSGYKPPPRT